GTSSDHQWRRRQSTVLALLTPGHPLTDERKSSGGCEQHPQSRPTHNPRSTRKSCRHAHCAPREPRPLAVPDLSGKPRPDARPEEHTSELQSRFDLVCRLLLEKKTHQAVKLIRL